MSLFGISKERVGVEIRKFFEQPSSVDVALLDETHLSTYLVPEFKRCMAVRHDNTRRHHGETVYEHTKETVSRLPEDANPLLKMAGWLHDVGKPDTVAVSDNKVTFIGHEDVGAAIAEARLRWMSFSNEQVKYVTALIKHHMELNALLTSEPLSERNLATLYLKTGGNLQFLQDLMTLSEADTQTPHEKYQEITRILNAWAALKPAITSDDVNSFEEKIRGKMLMKARHLQLYQHKPRETLLTEIGSIAEAARNEKSPIKAETIPIPALSSKPRQARNMVPIQAGNVVKIPLNRDAVKLFDDLGDVWLVGGAVRDYIYSGTLEVDDLDVTINQDLDPLMARLQGKGVHISPIGLKFGVFTVNLGEIDIDVAHFRSETYRRGDRHPDVKWVKTIEEDLLRRDFTINAIALKYLGNDDGEAMFEVVDPYHGLEDLKAGLVRAVGDPKERFAEDALRVMRAPRLAAKLGLTIEPKTLKEIQYVVDRGIDDELNAPTEGSIQSLGGRSGFRPGAGAGPWPASRPPSPLQPRPQ